MESTWISKTIYKNALKKGNVYLTSALQTRNGITGYNVYVKRDGRMLQLLGHSDYWSEGKRCYHCTAWGTSRPLEIILSIGHALGLKFHEMKQNWSYM